MQVIRLLLLCYLPLSLWSEPVKAFGPLDPFFSYSTQELNSVRSVPLAKEQLTQQAFGKWDSIVYELTTNSRPDGLSTRLMAYLYTAQRDFALLSHQISNQWIGNPDPLTVDVIHLVYPEFQPSEAIQEDLYSAKIREIVLRKIEDRFQREQANLKYYPLKEGPNYWKEEPPYLGQRIGSCEPWLLESVKDLQALPPPDFNSIIWAYGIHEIKFDQKHLTPEQRKLITYWAGQEGPESGNWFAIVNRDLQNKPLSLSDFLFIRAVLAMGYSNAMIAAFDSKYTYLIPRPYMRNPEIPQIVNCPKHPSYPSAHSVTSATAATILSHFFPEERQKWQNLAFEAGDSRIWGGLHYMYDNEQGLIQGEKVGHAVLKHLAPLSQEQ
jgi:hypothetical protein